MNTTNYCPCCSNTMVHHIGHNKEYWFCRNCWQEMPNLESFEETKQRRRSKISSLSVGFPRLKQPLSI